MLLKSVLALVFSLLIALISNGFHVSRGRKEMRLWQMSTNPTLAAVSLVKKGKKKVIDELKKEIAEQGENHIVNKFLNHGERPFNVKDPIEFYPSIKFNKGTVSVLAEYNKKCNTGFILGLPPPEIMGGVLRDGGAKAIVVSMDGRSGGVSSEEFERLAREQSNARLYIPSSIPLVWNDLIVDDVQISLAAALGAAAVVLQASLLDNFKQSVQYAKSLKLEPVVLIKSKEDADIALEAGCRVLCLHGMAEEQLVALHTELTSSSSSSPSSSSDTLYIARLRPEESFTAYHEIDTCWLLRDQGFTSVWPSPEALYATGMSDVYTTIAACRAKASRKFLSPRQFLMERKKEGATEYLGDILY